ncbi:MAG: lysophospholipid acyltransferase family protein [Chloroflexota bacterium]|nr:lysophospholipid acyltransferase family protein [Chloroflexota bacterium]
MQITPRARFFRSLFRALARWVARTLTRQTITGQDTIPTERPLIFAANHASTYDALLLLAHLPPDTQWVGPGDFKLLFPANLLVPLAGIVLVKRAALDRDSIRLMSGALEVGANLALFPEGGTWEKRLDDVKAGAAYLSQLKQVPIVPLSFGGTYQVWGKIVRLQRPPVTIHFGEPLPPPPTGDRKARGEVLQTASRTLMQRIYAHLPPPDQARYDVAARAVYHGSIICRGSMYSASDVAHENEGSIHSAVTTHDFPVLAELASKPNLVSPLWRNARLPLKPLVQHSVYYAAADFVIAAERLQSAFSGAFAGYLNYRLGDDKAAAGMAELALLRDIALEAHHAGQRLRFLPRVEWG